MTISSSRAGLPSDGASVLKVDQPRGAVPGPRVVAAVLAAVLVVVVWKTGPGKVPNVENFELIARTWPTPDPPQGGYVLRSALGQLLYAASPLQSTMYFLLLHMAATAAAGLLLAVWLVRHCGFHRGTTAVVLMLLSPVTSVLLLWIGMYDAFSTLVWVLLLPTLAVRGRARLPLQAGAGLLCGLQNFEQALVGLVVLALLPELPRAARLRLVLPALVGGLFAGKLVLEQYLGAVGAPSGSRLQFLLDDPTMLRNAFITFALTAPLVVFSMLGGLWAYLLPELAARWPVTSVSLRIRLALAAGGWLGAGVLGLDHSRVLAMIAFPAVVMLTILLADRFRDVVTLVRSPVTWFVLLVPPVVVFDRVTLGIGLKSGLWGVGGL